MKDLRRCKGMSRALKVTQSSGVVFRSAFALAGLAKAQWLGLCHGVCWNPEALTSSLGHLAG